MNEKQMGFVGLCKNGAGYWPHGRFGPQYSVNKELKLFGCMAQFHGENPWEKLLTER